MTTPALSGIPVDFFLFALTLVGVTVFHRFTLQIALTGLRSSCPAHCAAAIAGTVTGDPDTAHVSTSYVERQHLGVRMGNRRFTDQRSRLIAGSFAKLAA